MVTTASGMVRLMKSVSISWVIKKGPPRHCIASTIERASARASSRIPYALSERQFYSSTALTTDRSQLDSRWIECDSFAQATSRRRRGLLPISKHPELKDYSVITCHRSAWYESCCMGQSIEENKEAVMNTLVTLTATMVLLSSLLLLHRVW